MRHTSRLFIAAVLFIICTTTAALAQQDLKIVIRTSANGQTISESTSYIKGSRRRIEQKMGGPGMDENVARMMPSIATISQCDRRRMLQVNDKAKKYLITQLDETGMPASAGETTEPATDTGSTQQGGLVTYITTVTDTGQRQDMFGYKARYLKISTTVEPGPGACTPKSHYEQEGWYIDLQADFTCSTDAPVQTAPRAPRTGCQDRFRYRITGTGKMGFPLSVTTTRYDDQNRPQTVKQEVIDLKRVPLENALFDVPAGYTQAKDAQELYAVNAGEMMAAMSQGNNTNNGSTGESAESNAAEAKRPGSVRIGVAPVSDKSGRGLSTASFREQLIGNLSDDNLDAVALTSLTGLEDEARQKGCDFILYTDISAIKQPKSGKVGGLLGRAAGVGSMGAGKSESQVEFRLVALGATSPQLQSTATAKEEGDEASVAAALEQEARMVKAAARKQ